MTAPIIMLVLLTAPYSIVRLFDVYGSGQNGTFKCRGDRTDSAIYLNRHRPFHRYGFDAADAPRGGCQVGGLLST